jgi:hypothetical protein
MNKHQAIYAIVPNATVIRGDEAFDAAGNPVSYDEAAVQAHIDANAYKEQRAKAYPSIADQLDQIYHQGLDAWKATILAVKEEFPK